ncbi:MAG: DUF6457 domain-containing protein [Candidatus Dormibacteraeota bacterium]|nr:DUF6457 domain-containing protein [Candidatus Dormibacteraeota bacterium]
MNEFFTELGERLAAAAAARGVDIDAPGLDPATANELLELARAVAHTEERRFAPLATFVAGVAFERLRAGTKAGHPDPVAYLLEVRSGLENRSKPE